MDNFSDRYLTLEASSRGLYKEKGSKFIGLAFPVQSLNEIKELLEKIRKEYHDARHQCYAYQLGTDPEIYRVNDDGEPSNSAGKPIYGQLLSHQLTYVLIIVVRYFGGIKLGVSGLIHAYRSAAADAIACGKIVERFEMENIQLTFGYERMPDVMRIIRSFDLEPTNQSFMESCFLQISVRKSVVERIIEKLSGIGLEVRG